MKKYLSSLLLLLIISTFCYGAALQPFIFSFTGKWNPSDNPLLLDNNGIQDIQNLRKSGKKFIGVSGHSAINTSYVSGASNVYPYTLNGFHFHKDQPSESHVIIYSVDDFTATAGNLYQNTSTVPGTGDFSATPLYSPSTFSDLWQFSMAPAGNMIASNGDNCLIWGGDEIEATSVITSSGSVTYTVNNSIDYSNILNNTRQTADQVATFIQGGGNDAYTKLLLHCDGPTAFIDSSSASHAITSYNQASISSLQSKFGGYSGKFDGSGDYLTSPYSTDWYFGSSPFTIEFWTYFSSVTSTSTYYQQSGASSESGFYWDHVNKLLVFYDYTGSYVYKIRFTAALNPTINTWYHIALVRVNTDNAATGWRIYVNGVAQALTLTDGAWNATLTAHTSDITIARGHYGDLNGYLDEYRLSNGVARWTSNFSVPTSPYSNVSNNFLVGSKRQLKGVKLYVNSGNTIPSTLTAKEWQGASWGDLTITDNTIITSAGSDVTLGQTGAVTWDYTGNAKTRYINGLSLYWYQFAFNAGQTSLYYITTDAPIQQVRNIWDGAEEYCVKVLKYTNSSATYTDYTAETGDDSLSSYANFSSLGTSDAIYIGFLEPQQAIDVTFVAGSENSNTATMTLQYWDGSAWTTVPAFNDATSSSAKSFSKAGVISWQSPGYELDRKRAISDEYPLYYYKITFSGALDAQVYVGEIRGIPYPRDIPPYKFSRMFQNRTFLFNEKTGQKNKAVYSVANSPDIYNGDDSGEIFFGDKTDLIAATTVYNIFQNTAVEQLLVTKKNETWRVSGSSPDDWVLQKMSGNIGCVAPLSMVSAEVTTTSNETARSVAIWVSDKGPVMSDGATILPIGEEIKCYWDQNDARYIPVMMQSRSFGWYDTKLKSYKLLIASGSSATYLNTELEYSLINKEWTKVYRENAAGANPLQSGWQVFDSNGVGYTYGGGKDGYVYRLEYGNNWNGEANITSYLRTKDLFLDSQLPMFRKTTVKYLRTLYEKKNVGNITLTHYGDGTATTSGVSGQVGPAVITNASTTNYNTQSTNLGPYLYHSFMFSATTDVTDGLELTGFGIYNEPYDVMR